MMSSVLEKTLEQTYSLLRGNAPLQSNPVLSLKHLQQVLITTNRSMHMPSYRNIIKESINGMKLKTQETNMSSSGKRECLLIIIQLANIDEQLDFVHPFVIKCIVDALTIQDKLLGYTALILLNQSEKSSVYLAVNTILKDVCSKSSAVACIALTALASLIDLDLIPVFLPCIEKLMRSGASAIRRKAMYVLHAMGQIGPEYIVSMWDKMKHCLCDRDPHIMSCCLPIVETLLKFSNPPSDAKIQDKIIYILMQVEQGRLPIDMMYGGICGPWIQIRLLHIIRTLPKENYSSQNFLHIEDILSRIFSRFQTAGNLQLAIIEESVRVISRFQPQLQKLENLMLDVVEVTLGSSDLNLLQTGIEILKIIATMKPKLVTQYIDTLIKNIWNSNEALTKAIARLLEDLASVQDSENIVNALIKSFPNVINNECKKHVLHCFSKLIEKFPMTEKWILEHYLPVLALCGNSIDFPLIKRVVICFSSLSAESMEFELLKLCKSITEQNTPSQYCAILQIFMFYTKRISKDNFKMVVDCVLSNSRKMFWKSHVRCQILQLSLSCVIALQAYHNIEIEEYIEELRRASSIPLQPEFAEANVLVKNQTLLNSISLVQLSDIDASNFDMSLSFLDDYTKENLDSEFSSDNELNAVELYSTPKKLMLAEDTSKFLIKPYSKSRFDSTTSTVDDDKVRKNFLEIEAKSNIDEVSNVWNKSKYELKNVDSGNSCLSQDENKS